MLGVGQGSVRLPRLIELKYSGGQEGLADRADRQGHRVRLELSIKDATGMEWMKSRHGRRGVDPGDDAGGRAAQAEDQRDRRDPLGREHAERIRDPAGDVLKHRGGTTSRS